MMNGVRRWSFQIRNASGENVRRLPVVVGVRDRAYSGPWTAVRTKRARNDVSRLKQDDCSGRGKNAAPERNSVASSDGKEETDRRD